MNIGFGTTMLSKGLSANRLDGLGVYSKFILNEFKKSKHKVSTYRFYTKENIVSNHTILKSNLPYSIHSGLSALLGYPFGNFSEIEKKLDLFFAPDHHIPYMKTIPVVATVMDIIPFIHPQWASPRLRRVKNYAFKKAILSADHIITVSQYSKNEIIKYFNIDKCKVSVVMLGVDKKYFIRINEDTKLTVLKRYNLEKNFFIFVGTLQPRKNIMKIIEAFESLPVSIKERNHLIIVGQNGWKTDELIIKLHHLQKSGYGRWLNYVPDDQLLSLLQSAIALVYPSLYEGFGLPIVEAFASNCPVISSNTTSIPEVAGDAAILVDPNSIDQISSAMYKISTNSELRTELISKGQKQVKKFTWSKSAQVHLDILQKVLEQQC